MSPRLIVPLVVALLCSPPTARAKDAASNHYHLDREDLVRSDTTLVVRLSLTLPEASPAGETRLEFRWHDEIDQSTANVMHGATDAAHRADVLIVAQAAHATENTPPMLVLTTKQASRFGVAHTVEAHRLPMETPIADLLTITVKPGDYALGDRLKIGTLGGDPIHLTVTPAPPARQSTRPAPGQPSTRPAPIGPPAAWRDAESDQLRVTAQNDPDALTRRFGPAVSHVNQDGPHHYLAAHVFEAPSPDNPERALLEWVHGADTVDVYWTTTDGLNDALSLPGPPNPDG